LNGTAVGAGSATAGVCPDIRGVDVSVLLGGGECAGNLEGESVRALASDQANGGCSAVPDPWADLDIPEMLRR
jgi:hypothetical protein